MKFGPGLSETWKDTEWTYVRLSSWKEGTKTLGGSEAVRCSYYGYFSYSFFECDDCESMQSCTGISIEYSQHLPISKQIII